MFSVAYSVSGVSVYVVSVCNYPQLYQIPWDCHRIQVQQVSHRFQLYPVVRHRNICSSPQLLFYLETVQPHHPVIKDQTTAAM